MGLCRECNKHPKQPGKGQQFCSEDCRKAARAKQRKTPNEYYRKHAEKKRRATGMKKRVPAWDANGNRRCPNCEQFVPLSEFRAGYCLTCGPRLKRDRQLRKTYGITLAEFEAMLEAQGGVCAICLEVPRPPQMDHCHETGLYRGILCRTCNYQLLGLVKDNDEILRRAADYIADHRTRHAV